MPIKNLSERRRLPRLGKIHLGVKAKSSSGKEYPKEVDYFVVPPKVAGVYGDKPKELKIMFPVEDPEVFFQQWYKCYGYSVLKCKGDGEVALTWDADEGGMKEIPCPCEKLKDGGCKQVGTLQFLLPDVPGAGVWQITTSSKNSIIDLNSAIEVVRGYCMRIRMIELVLRRVETITQRIDDKGEQKTGKHYTLQIDLENTTLRELQEKALIAPDKVALLPEPPDESKEDLLYPENGHKPEDETFPDTEKEEAFPEDEDTTPGILVNELDELLGKYTTLGGELSKKAQDRLGQICSKREYQDAILFYDEKVRQLEGETKEPQLPIQGE